MNSRENIKRYKVRDIRSNMSEINIIGELIGIEDRRNFKRSDESTGMVRGLAIGDETGKIRVALWDEKAKDFDASGLELGDAVAINGGYARERYGEFEIHVGKSGEIKISDEEVKYEEKILKIDEIGLNERCTIMGSVIEIEGIREFVKKDGSVGKVVNIYVEDETARVRVSLWGEHTDFIKDVSIGSTVKIMDGYAKIWKDEIELNVDWNSKIGLVG